MTQYGFFIDLSRCTGCHACTIACKQWHDIDPGPVKWMRVHQWETGVFPGIGLRILPLMCAHCQRPLCLDACPNRAIYKEDKYGAVLVDPAKCSGARKCWQVCPYGAPQFEDDGPNAKMSKCNMCIDRLEQGQAPICVLSCSLRALEFGPLEELQNKFGDGADDKHGIRKDRAPCRLACPAGLDVQGYVEKIAEGRMDQALAVIRRATPFAGVLGRVCTHPCESACFRKRFDDTVAICDLKRAVADFEHLQGRPEAAPLPVTQKQKVAVIGAGPAGLSCAYDVIQAGYAVTVFEARKKSGGLLRYGICEERLPGNVLDDEVAYIEALGVEIRTRTPIKDLESIFSQGYAALFLGIGVSPKAQVKAGGAVDHPNLLRHAGADLPVNPKTLQTADPRIFAGGDFVTGPTDAVNAMAQGKTAAASITRFLKGQDVAAGGAVDTYRRQSPTPDAPDKYDRERYSGGDRVFDLETAVDQARRCLQCGTLMPSLVIRPQMPKKQIVPWNPTEALVLWRQRNPAQQEDLPPVYEDADDVFRAPEPGMIGRDKLVLKPRNTNEALWYTTDDE